MIHTYKAEIEKQAALGAAISGVAKSVLPKAVGAVKSFSKMPTGKRALIGAGANSAVSGLTYSGNDGAKGRIKAMVGGAVNGGLIGGMASTQNISRAGSTISGQGKRLTDNAVKLFGEGSIANTAGKAGEFATKAGNKIQDAFKG